MVNMGSHGGNLKVKNCHIIKIRVILYNPTENGMQSNAKTYKPITAKERMKRPKNTVDQSGSPKAYKPITAKDEKSSRRQ